MRLGFWGRKHPKPLICLSGKTLFERYCEQFVSLGITKVEWIFAKRYRSKVESFLNKYEQQSALNISVTYEPVPRGITPALIDQAPKVKTNTLLLLGDVFFTKSFAAKCPEVSEEHPIALGVSQTPADAMKNNCNINFTPNNVITRILDKPAPDEIMGPWAWTGWFLLHPSIFDQVEKLRLDAKITRHMLLGDFFEELRKKGVRFIAAPEAHWHINLNTRADIRQAEKFLTRKDR